MHVRQADDDLADAERHLAGTRQALAQVEADVLAMRRERGSACEADPQQLAEAEREQAAGALATLASATHAVMARRGALAWLHGGKVAKVTVLPHLPGISTSGGRTTDTWSMTDALAAIGKVLEQWQAPEEADEDAA